DVRVRRRRRPHRLAWFDREHANAAIAKQSRRNPGSRADVGGNDLPGRSESVEDGVHRSRGIRRPVLDVVGCTIGETGDRIHISYQLPATSYELPVTSYQLPVTS